MEIGIEFNHKTRANSIAVLQQNEYDVIIIGGGITGAGILLDAVSRGLTALLIEKEDFASGTSSKSTKLIHGGLRYLKNLEFKIVRDTGRERSIAYKNAPHLVIPEKMLLPITENGTYGQLTTSIALSLYDRLAGVPRPERRKMLSDMGALRKEPTLNSKGLKGAGCYTEYRTDDARLTISILKTAVQLGGVALNYAECVSLNYNTQGDIDGLSFVDHISNTTLHAKGAQVVNACGPWSDSLRSLDRSSKEKKLRLSKGVHIVVPKAILPVTNSVYFDTGKGDGRMVFAIPRLDTTYIGTTDTFYDSNPDLSVVNRNDVDYLIQACKNAFPKHSFSMNDIVSSWSGLRPLIHEEGKSPKELSRKDEIYTSSSGLITIAGGKLTGYRLMAKKIVDILCKGVIRLSPMRVKNRCVTDGIKISGGEFNNISQLKDYMATIEFRLTENGLDKSNVEYLVRNYGKETDQILSIFKTKAIKSLVQAEALYCLQYEQTLSLLDFYIRRTGKMYFDISSIEMNLPSVTNIFQSYLGWNDEKLAMELDMLRKDIYSRTHFV